MNCSMPAARASSTAYWISGLSTTGSISFGIALVAGRKRVPRPPTGKTALRTGRIMGRAFGHCSSDGRGDNGMPRPVVPCPLGAALYREACAQCQRRRLSPQEDILGAIDLRRQRVGAALIGMDLHHEPVVSLLDLDRAGARLEAEDGQGLVLGHRDAGRVRRAALGAAGTPRRLAPVRHEAVEIALDQAH